jgi:hypothetical protein
MEAFKSESIPELFHGEMRMCLRAPSAPACDETGSGQQQKDTHSKP